MQLPIEIVAEGLLFPEGPIAMADGSVVLVEIRLGTGASLLILISMYFREENMIMPSSTRPIRTLFARFLRISSSSAARWPVMS